MPFISYLVNRSGQNVSNGTPMRVGELEDVLKFCKTIDINAPKGSTGCMAAYNTGVAGDISSTGGVVFTDFDHMPKSYIDMLYEHFEDLAAMCTPLLAINTSHSYINPERVSKDDCGIHVMFRSAPLEGDEDKIAAAYLALAVNASALFSECVHRILGIDLDPYTDGHSDKPTQRLYLNHCDYRYNRLAAPLMEDTLSEDDWEKLKKKHPAIYKRLGSEVKPAKKREGVKANIAGGTCEAASDRYIIEYCEPETTDKFGNDERYPIINMLAATGFSREFVIDEMCAIRGRDDAKFKKEIGVQYKYGEKHKKDLTQEEFDYAWWLYKRRGRILKEKEFVVEIPENEYLSYYANQIDEEFKKRGRILIQAPTGAGKTTLMIELAKKHNAVILVPFNSMLKLYEQGSHGDIVIVGSGYTAEYTEKKPVCMIWDRAIGFDLTDRVVISDETHQWFSDRDYRDSAVKTIKKAKEWKQLICISATPAGEAEELGLYVMKFTKKRAAIPTRLVNVRYSGGYIRELIENREPGVNYVVFSDRNAMNLYQNFPEGCLLHSKKKNTHEYNDVLDNQMLNNSLTFCTAIAYNGLNFRNTGDYKVIIDIEIGSDTANKIIQAVGRLRNANILEVIVVLSGGGEKQSVAEKVVDNKILKDIDEKYEGARVVTYDRRYTEEDSIEAMTVIEKYLLSHNSKQSIIRDLTNEGYFTIQEERDDEKRSKLRALLKEATNLKFKEMVKEHNGHIDELNDEEIKEVMGKELMYYAKEWRDNMLGLEDDVDIDWVKVLEGRKYKCMMDTIINEIRDIYNVCRLSDDQFNECYSNARCEEALNWKDENGNTLSEQAKIKVRKRFANAHKIREQYEVVCNEYETTYEDGDPVERLIGDLLDSKVVSRRISKELKRKGGENGNKAGKRKGGRKGKEIKVQDANGKVLKFKTLKDAADKFGVSLNTMRTYIKKGKFEIVVKVKKCVYQVINQ